MDLSSLSTSPIKTKLDMIIDQHVLPFVAGGGEITSIKSHDHGFVSSSFRFATTKLGRIVDYDAIRLASIRRYHHDIM